MVKTKGLGRGLEALLGDDLTRVSGNDILRSLSIDQVQPGKYQPRTLMDQESLQQLADSIKAQGIMQPILVRPTTAGEKFEIIAGERRWRAAQIAGLEEIPALVREIPDESALAMALIENIQRENLNPLEEANGIQRLLDEFGLTHEAAAQAVGRSRVAVTNLLRLRALNPHVQEMLMLGKLDMGHARALLSLDNARQIATAEEVFAKKLSVRETERLVQKSLAPIQKNRDKQTVRDVKNLEESISEKLGVRVQIKHTAQGKGTLSIHFDTLDQLESISYRLTQ